MEARVRRLLSEVGERPDRAQREIAGILALEPLDAYEASERTAVREVEGVVNMLPG